MRVLILTSWHRGLASLAIPRLVDTPGLEVVMGGNMGRKVLNILVSENSVEEKLRLLKKTGLTKSVFERIVTQYEPSAQLAQRLKRMQEEQPK